MKQKTVHEGWQLPPFETLDELIALVEKRRSTKIDVVEDSNLDPMCACGLWVGDGRSQETIIVPALQSPMLRLQTICHELAHMLQEPVDASQLPAVSAEVEEFLALVLPLDRRVSYAYARSTFTSDLEAAAEATADELALTILHADRRRRRQGDRFRFDHVFQ